MSDLRSIVDRELERVEVRPFTLETFHRRREQKRRNQRIRAGVVGIAVALIAVLIGTSIIRSSPVPAGPQPSLPAPHGAELTYSTDRGMVAIDPATGQRTLIPLDLVIATFAWSPDGSELAYELKAKPCSVVVRTIATGAERVLADCTSPGRYGAGLDWSADGNWIAFPGVSESGPGSSAATISLIHPDGTGEHQLTDPDGFPIITDGFSLSPDGSQLAFDSGRQIFTMNVDGSDRRLLADGWSPDWSPDGTSIIFARDPYLPRSIRGHGDPYVWQVLSIHPDGSGLITLHEWKHCCIGWWATGPRWSPDASQIAVGAESRLWLLAADGSLDRKLGRMTTRPAPEWRPHL